MCLQVSGLTFCVDDQRRKPHESAVVENTLHVHTEANLSDTIKETRLLPLFLSGVELNCSVKRILLYELFVLVCTDTPAQSHLTGRKVGFG